MVNPIDLLTQLPRGSEIVQLQVTQKQAFMYDYFVVTKTAIYYVNQDTTPTSLELAIEVQGINPDKLP